MHDEIKAVTDAVDPLAYPWITYLWVCLISAWGGLVRFLNSVRDRKESVRDALFTLFAGVVTSTFVGVITFYICELAHASKLSTAVAVAITGHMGSEALRIFNKLVMARIAAFLAPSGALASSITADPTEQPTTEDPPRS